MANVTLQVINPKQTDVTVNSQVAKARRITTLTIDNTTTDAYGFLAAGCALTNTAASNISAREEEGFMLMQLQLG